MSYILCLFFKYHRYKRDAVMRVFADDHLIDEISFCNDIKIKCHNHVDYPGQSIGPKNTSEVLFLPEKIFLFEIDEYYLNDRIRIEVKNDNNNYTNGFMTEFSYLKFYEIFLFPKCLLEYKNWKSLYERFGGQVDVNGPEGQPWSMSPTRHDIVIRSNIMKKQIHWLEHVLGGSFSLDVPLSRKYGIVHPNRLPPKKMYLDRYSRVKKILWGFDLINMSK